jgi:uncharacterized membrane protein
LRTSLFSAIPDRDDRGVDTDYRQFRDLRAMAIGAALLSAPFWLTLLWLAAHALYLHYTGGR